MGTCNIRRGQSWQNSDWRQMLAIPGDLCLRAQTVFATQHRQKPQADASRFDLARMTAPFFGDGVPVGEPFTVHAEYAPFA